MRYHILACDYDGTLAHHGRVGAETIAALERLLATGRKLVLVTGRELDELLGIFPEIHFFVRVVAENGALLYRPDTKERRVLAEAPPVSLIQALERRKIPLSVGKSILATWRPHEVELLEAIHEQGVEWHVIFNKDAVMALPSGVNKASGLAVALSELNLSPHEVVGVGDAENDHAFLTMCECGVSVANALPALKERTDWTTRGDHGVGVAELIAEMIGDDLASRDNELKRHHLLLGYENNGTEVWLSPFGPGILIAGPSGTGKSTAAGALLERLRERNYQFCVVDPEGDYVDLPGSVCLGNQKRGPTADEVVSLEAHSRENVVVNLLGQKVVDRPAFFLELLPRLLEMCARIGRPHWLVMDEAHHLLPRSWEPGLQVVPNGVDRALLITVHPDQVSTPMVNAVGLVFAIGPSPWETVKQFCLAIGEAPPDNTNDGGLDGHFLLWSRVQRMARWVKLKPSTAEHRRHSRKYAEGDLPPERSFYFRGREAKLNLRAQNLALFMQLAWGVDDDTWQYHLAAGDYSEWFRSKLKDDVLATEAAQYEANLDLPPQETRRLIGELIEKYYTQPSRPPMPMPGTDAASTKD